MLRRIAFGFALLGVATAAAQDCSESAGMAAAQRSRSEWSSWCSACGGTVQTGPRCVPGPNWKGYSSGGSSGGYTMQEQVALDLARVGSQLVADALREAIFGNPQREAELAQQRAWQAHEAQRMAQQRAREEDERYERLSVALMGFRPSSSLEPMGMESGSGELKPMLGDAAEASSSQGNLPGRIELAGAWSTLAVQAESPEGSVTFANAAFNSLLGAKVGLPRPPPHVKGRPVGGAAATFDELVREYQKRIGARGDPATPLAEAEYRVQVLSRTQARLRAQERLAKDLLERKRIADALAETARLQAQADAHRRTVQEDERRKSDKAKEAELDLRGQIASLGAPGPGHSGIYINLGFQDATLCFSQNAGPRCTLLNAPRAEFQACLDGYHIGYRAGLRVQERMLKDAFARGVDARANSRQGFADTDPLADGSCRYDYVMSYNRGYFQQ